MRPPRARLRFFGLAIPGLISEEVPKELVQQVRGTTLLAEVLVGLKRLTLPDLDLGQSKQLPGAVTEALIQGELGYALLTATRAAG